MNYTCDGQEESENAKFKKTDGVEVSLLTLITSITINCATKSV